MIVTLSDGYESDAWRMSADVWQVISPDDADVRKRVKDADAAREAVMWSRDYFVGWFWATDKSVQRLVAEMVGRWGRLAVARLPLEWRYAMEVWDYATAARYVRQCSLPGAASIARRLAAIHVQGAGAREWTAPAVPVEAPAQSPPVNRAPLAEAMRSASSEYVRR